jgi:hypothetical protein
MKAYHMFNAYIYLEASHADTSEDNQHKHGLKPAKGNDHSCKEMDLTFS